VNDEGFDDRIADSSDLAIPQKSSECKLQLVPAPR
jgi:hypothetical protein